MKILHLFVSDGHNYVGHHGKPASRNPIREVAEVECVAGRGIKGDRFFDHDEDFRGQITFSPLKPIVVWWRISVALTSRWQQVDAT